MVAALIDTLYLAGKEENLCCDPSQNVLCAKKPYLDSGCVVPWWSILGDKSFCGGVGSFDTLQQFSFIMTVREP